MAENAQPETSEPIKNARRWKLTLAYDGTDYKGWQVQPGEVTIQGELQAALGRVTGERPLPQGSGRTDAGVHALGQVASFALQAPIPPENLQRALNRTLPAAIRILTSRTVRSTTFHARHSAVAKTYEYRIFRETICPPVLARYVYDCAWPLDLEKLRESAQFFVGEHNFLSFVATDPDLTDRDRISLSEVGDLDTAHSTSGTIVGAPFLRAFQRKGGKPLPEAEEKSPIRTIYSSAWERRQTDAGELLVYRVRGNGFLHHMVRNLVGTMVDVGRGYRRVDEIPEILAARARAAAGPTAPARGLFLHSVEYPEDAFAPVERP